MHRQKAFATLSSNDRVHLDNSRIRILLYEALECVVVSPDPAALVHFEFGFFIACTELHFPGQVDVAYIHKTGVDVVLDGFLTTHELILMAHINLMDRLPLLYQRTDNSV